MSRIVSGAALGLAAALGLTLAACGGSSKSSNPLSAPSGSTGTVVVGSANFPESQLVGEIYAQALEAKGIKVTRRFNLAAREGYYPHVVSGPTPATPKP